LPAIGQIGIAIGYLLITLIIPSGREEEDDSLRTQKREDFTERAILSEPQFPIAF
jgi:hypothetical protein